MISLLSFTGLGALAQDEGIPTRGGFEIYKQDFGTGNDGSALPTGWTTSGDALWTINKQTGSTVVPPSYTGASGPSGVIHNKIGVSMNDKYGALIYTFSSVGYKNLTVLWGARRYTGAESPVLEWSSDGTTWTSVTFTDIGATTYWGLVNGGAAITLPALAEGASSLQLRWTHKNTTYGPSYLARTYRFDDFTLWGECADIPPAPGVITGSSTVCIDNTTQLSTDGDTGGTWASSDENTATVDDTGLVTGMAEGEITITYTVGPFGCTHVSDPFTVTVNPLPVVTAGDYGPVCIDGADITLVGDPAGGVWTGTGVSGDQTDGYVFDPFSETQELTYTYTDLTTGCENSAKTTITVNPLPESIIEADEAVCSNSTGNIASVPDAGAGATYTWEIHDGVITAGDGTNSITYTAGYNFGLWDECVVIKVQVTNSNGCTSSGRETVKINPLPKIFMVACSDVCSESIGNAASVIDHGTGVSYAWSIVNGEITSATDITNITYTAGTSGVVQLTVVVTNDLGCSVSISKSVTITPTKVEVTMASSVCAGSKWNLAWVASGGLGSSYDWTIENGTILFGSGLKTVTYVAGTTGTVTLTVIVTNSSGCQSEGTASAVINEPPTVLGITGTPTVASGSTTQLANLSPDGTWSSSVPYVASVNSSGLVTGLFPGSTVISYTRKNDCGSITTMLPVTVTSGSGTATISYSGSPFCNQNSGYVTLIGQSGGKFTSSSWFLRINETTGTINLALSLPGTYIVTYTYKISTTTYKATAKVVVKNCKSGQISSDEDADIAFEEASGKLTVYPNPANGPITFNFSNGNDGWVTLDLLNIQGQLISRLFDANLSAGENQTVFFEQKLGSGTYIYRLTSADGVKTGKLIMLE